MDSGNVDSLMLLMYYGQTDNGNFMNDAQPNSDFFDLDCTEDSYPSKARPVVSADLINHADKEGWTAAHIAASKGFKVCLYVVITIVAIK